MIFSNQKGYCFICGNTLSWTAMNFNKFCSKGCQVEYKWRESLSTMGKEYYEQPKKET